MAPATVESFHVTPTGAQGSIPSSFTQHVHQSDLGSTVEAFIPNTKRVAARPKKILFGVIAHPRLRIKRPIRLEVSRKKGTVVAHCTDLNEFGCGVSMSDALDDFSKGIAELFFSLEQDSDRLGSDLAKLKEKLGRYVEPRPAK
jgi:hypothetical protein